MDLNQHRSRAGAYTIDAPLKLGKHLALVGAELVQRGEGDRGKREKGDRFIFPALVSIL